MTAARPWARPAIFGAFDGLVTAVGVILTTRGHATIPVAIGQAGAGLVGMAAGEWLSDSDVGFIPALVIGAATAAATVLPAVPALILGTALARILGLVLVVAVGWLIVQARDDRGTGRAAAETYGVLTVASVLVWLLALGTGGAS